MSNAHYLRELLAGAVPAIAVSFGDRISDNDIALARSDGLDVAELRIDRYSSADESYVLEQVRRFAAVPTIATIRTQQECGDWTGTEEDRLNLFRAVLPEVAAVDIELSSSEILPDVVAAARDAGRAVIVSNHNFQLTPSGDALVAMARSAKEFGADYVKISAMARSTEDIRTLATFTLRHSALGLIVIAMGGHGTVSRVLFPALGSRLTYAHGGQLPVSGQLSYEETFRMLRVFYPDFNERKIITMQLLEGA